MCQKSFSYMNKMIKAETDRINRNILDIAQRVCYIKYKELWKENYKSFNEYIKKELKLKKSSVSAYTKVVYKFCKEDDNSSTGYCVKSLFKDYTFSQLREMTILTEDEYRQLCINPSMTEKQIRKIVKDYISVLQGLKDQDEKIEGITDQKQVINDSNITGIIKDSIFRFFDCDKCLVKDMKKTVSVNQGLNYLKNQIVKDNEHVYMVVKVPKNYLEKGD